LKEFIMKAVAPAAPSDVTAWRKHIGADRWDEMWDGVLHMPPPPNLEHQDLGGALEAYLRFHWAPKHGAKVYHEVAVAPPGGGWSKNYRAPDLVLLLPQSFGLKRGEYIEGALDVAVEIHSPGDEAYEKLSFYAQLGVPEVWIIHRDTKEPEIHVLKRGRYKKQAVRADGWLRSPGTGIEMRVGRPGKLAVRLAGDEASRQELPGD
jgi:Uma2 family endonuclease